MPRTQNIFTAFTTGEISPRINSRIDFNKYANAVEKMENATIFSQGGFTRRPGLRYVNEVKDSTKATRVVKFEFSVTDSYILEFGDLYIRFYRNQARIESPPATPVEVVTTYAEADLFDLHFAQSADVLYIAHKDYAPRKLVRGSHTSWALSIISFDPAPSFVADTDIGDGTNEDITLTALTGDGVTVSPDHTTEDLFLPADVGRTIVSGTGVGVIISHDTVATPDEVDIDILSDFASVNIADGNWILTGSPNETLTPQAVGPVGAIKNFTLASGGWRLTSAPNGGDVGKFIKINNGLAVITAVTSTTVAKAEILRVLDSTTAAVGGLWTLEVGSWSATRGFPAAIGFYEQRLFYARTDTQPQTIWGSVIDDFESFATGTNDTDSLDFTITGQNPIRWLSPSKKLGIGTFGGELTVGTTNDAAMSPTNIKIDDDTTYGSSALQPIRIGDVTLFVQRSKRKLREFVFLFENDSFTAPDLSLLAEHITEGGINDIAYQQELDSIVWMVRNDGQLLGLTYDRGQQIVGWHRQITGATGLFESVETIPISDKDQTWVVVNRTINGSVVRNIEYFDQDAWSGATEFDQWNQLNTDSAVVYNSTATTTITGLSHLEGEEVAVVVNGAAHPNKTVSSGQITLERSATEAEVGLAYTTDVDTVRPELQTDRGTVQGVVKGWVRINARLLNSLGGTINGEVIETRLPIDPMDKEPPLYTDDYEVQNLGYDKHARINIQQTLPYPLTVLSITGVLDIGGL